MSLGIAKVGIKLLLQISNFSFDRCVIEMSSDEMSVMGELWRASHRKEEEERSSDRLVSKEPVLSRLNGWRKDPTGNQIPRIPNMMAFHSQPP